MLNQGLYEQFRRWFKQKYGWFQSLAIPKNSFELTNNPYFYAFLEENNLWGAAPMARRAYEKKVLSQPLPYASYGEKMVGTAITPETGFDWSAPWVQKGMTRTDWETRYPDEAEEYKIKKQAEAVGLTPLQLRRHMLGLPLDEPTGEMTPYQREQLDLQRTELGQRQADIMNEERKYELANRANLLARETQRLSMFSPGANTAPYNAYRQQLADQFEQIRQLASGVTSPRNWVQTAYAQAGQGAFTNPFMQEPVSWVEESQRAKQEISAYTEARKIAEQKVKDLRARLDDSIPDNNPDPAEIEAAEFYRDQIKARESGAKHWLLEEQIRIGASREGKQIREWQTPRPSGATGFEVGGPSPSPGSAKSKPFTPAIPGDIQKFLEKPVWGAAVTRPSGQQWAATPWSSREKLFGYLESQGQYPIEMLEQMERELPRNPSLGRRWSPAKQFV